ncbi:SDR family oxidoreductase [Aestuariivirga sp.]|uniref:SDR family oxidoreductase n=1 Tax=Aestuariivirga sp. TaxID=2650926 RepID=UPI0039E6063D
MAQRVMITAAAAGIGRAIALGFAATGAKVHVCDVSEDALSAFRAENPGIAASHVDLRSEGAINGWFDTALTDLGGLDVLVNNAGIKGPTALVDDINYADWRECIEVCLDSHFLCAKRAAPVMKKQKSGSIINLSSTAGQFGYGARSPYAAAKWAVIGLTKSLAIELGPYDVTCNAICPGTVRGPRMARVMEAEAKQRGVSFEKVEAEYISGQSIKRFIEADEIAGLCVFLASPAARTISGQELAIDGHTETFHLG